MVTFSYLKVKGKNVCDNVFIPIVIPGRSGGISLYFFRKIWFTPRIVQLAEFTF